ncbi:MAG: ammonium transporter [Aeoliella sp.]
MSSIATIRGTLGITLTACGLAYFCAPAVAQDAVGPETVTLNSGDTAWILASTALVLFMTIPGLALFYGGLVRTRNVLSVLMQCLSLTALLSVLWIAIGYSLAFDTTGMKQGVVGLPAFIGGGDKAFLWGITGDVLSGSIPEVLFAAFQMTFAVITPALIIGAFAERTKFSACLWFSALWLLVVYAPICHMTWAGDGGLFADWGVLDFAGGIVVHVTAGCAALVACIVIGPRKLYPKSLEPPHNMTMTVTGTAMLWVGWFGFNAGSALAADGNAAMALLVTHLSASAATLTWMAIEWIKIGKPSVLGAATGSIAGLAAVTPASGFIGPVGGLAIGLCSGVLCWYFSTIVKHKLRYDDSLDVFGVHGIGGIVGTLLAGVFAAQYFGGNQGDLNIAAQVGVQAMAIVIAAVYTMAATWVILRLVDSVIGLRVSENEEIGGIDYALHDETGYNM